MVYSDSMNTETSLSKSLDKIITLESFDTKEASDFFLAWFKANFGEIDGVPLRVLIKRIDRVDWLMWLLSHSIVLAKSEWVELALLCAESLLPVFLSAASTAFLGVAYASSADSASSAAIYASYAASSVYYVTDKNLSKKISRIIVKKVLRWEKSVAKAEGRS